ncbi:molybdopterin molybdotransferase MoeA [Paracoccus aerodenitrificans]|uniref:molybdopterin molybdotransferase MoeA n=1 Tax=Paracoccus aerodenitrificans TaxID=3017781 RepID=UPI0022F05DA8|nr:gephyrin-like molybdotransferase Glp [Paracoccus aerodenitrificans]WBU63052.1 molybdopterin molybdotransferase MoeA [Paracoccus aerodenitrificans]
MITVDEALTRVLALAHPVRSERVPLTEALGRVLAEPVQAQLTQPPFDTAAMDGYALRQTDRNDPLEVIGEAAAGRPWKGEASPGTAIRIFTGAPVPAGYDMVAMQEDVTRDGPIIRVGAEAGKTHIRLKGADFTAGTGFDPHRPLTPRDIGLIAAMNVAELTIARRPKVAIIAGGDELVPPGSLPGPGQIICSNDIAIAGIARLAGAEAECLPIAQDTLESLRDRFRRAADADLIVTIGGASVGDHDLIGKLTEELGMERAFYKVAMRPGKPLIAGRIGGSAMIGLPGNPVSSIVCAEIFMRPLLRKMQGLPPENPVRSGRLGTDLPAEGDRQHYLRAHLTQQDGETVVTPVNDQDSARLGLLAHADALLIRPACDPASKTGDKIQFLALG